MTCLFDHYDNIVTLYTMQIFNHVSIKHVKKIGTIFVFFVYKPLKFDNRDGSKGGTK